MIFLLILLLLIQYFLVFIEILTEEVTRTNLKKDLIPFYGLYKRLLRQWYKLPK